MDTVKHEPVLLKEVLKFLEPKPNEIVFDGTLGGAGHAVAIYEAIAPTGILIGVDQDSQALSTAAIKIGDKKNVILVKDDYKNIKGILKRLDIGRIDAFFLDLGLSSIQIDTEDRGFSYKRDERIDMRMDQDNPLDAVEVLNNYSQEQLKDIFYRFGEERWSARIARNIVEYRKKKKITGTGELVEIIRRSVPGSGRKSKGGHPAKRVFQALRIEVNKELESLREVLEDAFDLLNGGGRMVIISYHSLEDRIVKERFSWWSGKCRCPAGIPECVCKAVKQADILTKKPVTAQEEETFFNPRAKSAKLRAIKKSDE
jgi:16S rRNA (cytosine1402-N4)-methyltransferase